MPEILPSSPQESRINTISGKIGITRWLIMATIAIGSYFAVDKAVSDTLDDDEIVLLQPKGGGLSGNRFIKIDKTDSDNSRMVADNPYIKKETIRTPLHIREKYKPENICYAGDSYMNGLTVEGDVELNIFAKNGRPFVSRAEKWNGDDIETIALRALENPDCRLLVINGGLNDLHAYHRMLKSVVCNIKKSYENIVRVANEKGVKVIIFNIPKIPKMPMATNEDMEKRLHRKNEINKATEELNSFLLTINDAHVIDTMEILHSSCGDRSNCRIWRKDKIHPGPRGYRALFKSL